MYSMPDCFLQHHRVQRRIAAIHALRVRQRGGHAGDAAVQRVGAQQPAGARGAGTRAVRRAGSAPRGRRGAAAAAFPRRRTRSCRRGESAARRQPFPAAQGTDHPMDGNAEQPRLQPPLVHRAQGKQLGPGKGCRADHAGQGQAAYQRQLPARDIPAPRPPRRPPQPAYAGRGLAPDRAGSIPPGRTAAAVPCAGIAG